MSLIDLRCLSCEHVFEAYRPASKWPETPPCEKCQSATEQAHFPKAVNWTLEPIVVFKAPDGGYRFPGDAQSKSVANYEKMGYERVELRSAADVRRFETQVNRHDLSIAQRKNEHKLAQQEAREKENRSELRRQMQSMSRVGRAVAQAAMDRNDAKGRARVNHPGFHSQVFSYDKSNREESRDAQGRRRDR